MAFYSLRVKARTLLMTYKVLYDKDSHNLSAVIYNYLPFVQSTAEALAFLLSLRHSRQDSPQSVSVQLIPLLLSRAMLLVFCGTYPPLLYVCLLCQSLIPLARIEIPGRYFFIFYSLLQLMNEYIVSCRITKAKGIQNFLMLQDTHLLSAMVSNTPDEDS